ncbi:MLX-interacting protein isoform X1 [Diorhabda carinulata]|uniref:MLX-interacting protein isoform X1 n=1 Tax=Diorhabda carinulata TaxID=1163345 RepID=UPI0025A00020|nr:MLX-interacting protein isoform X1 [Diorhabda carinulata]
MYTIQHVRRPEKPEKECIHSGHFMVSTFEAEEQDDEDNVAIPLPENNSDIIPLPLVSVQPKNKNLSKVPQKTQQQLSIDTSLAKLFQAMNIAYRQKLTSPKWNRFRGIRLRWKDKIRLNNVIWRCWHLQFIKKERTLVCQFASPLDVDTHNKPEAVVLEGKYWKRKLAAVTAEYKRWRMFYRNNILGHVTKEAADSLLDLDIPEWDTCTENMMMVDEDYMGLMSDTLFSTIVNQPFAFPDPREIAKAGIADFIQPSLNPLQPNLEDYMDLDPFQELIGNKLATVLEETPTSQHPTGWGYLEHNINSPEPPVEVPPMQVNQYQLSPGQQVPSIEKPKSPQHQNIVPDRYNEMVLQQQQQLFSETQSSYQSVISKNNTQKNTKTPGTPRSTLVYSKSMDNIYPAYNQVQQQSTQGQVVERISSKVSDTSQVQPQQIPEYLAYKLVTLPQQQGYKFSIVPSPNIKFTSPQVQQPIIQRYSCLTQYNSLPRSNTNEEEQIRRRRGGTKGARGRSRSNTREPVKRPPLVSTASDPSLLTPQNSVILTQLLTNNSEPVSSVYNRSISQGNVEMLPKQSHIRIKEESKPVPMLPQSTLIIPNMSTAQSTSDNMLLNSYSSSNSPVMDPLSQNIHSPTSSQGSVGSPGGDGANQRDRRSVHIHAEQKRRYNIKNGFDMIHSLIPHLNQNPNAKLSKAAMLQKGAEYIKQLREERNQLKTEMESLRQQIESLNAAISNCQSMLPATGAPVSQRRDSRMQEMFDEYVRVRTMENWKFWVFSLIFKSLLNSFNSLVSSSSLDDLYRSTMLWVEQHCTLSDLRPVVLNSLTYLCRKTDILSEPEKLPEEALRIVTESKSQNNN